MTRSAFWGFAAKFKRTLIFAHPTSILQPPSIDGDMDCARWGAAMGTRRRDADFDWRMTLFLLVVIVALTTVLILKLAGRYP